MGELLQFRNDMAVAAAEVAGVCRRPFMQKVTDRVTGEVTIVPIPCGSTRESKCPACAEKARRLRMQQCREGWHLADDPLPTESESDPEPEEPNEPQETERRIRSTRRIEGFPDLPKNAVEHCSVGRTFTDPKTGATFRPSMFVTLTLPSYGRITRGTGCPTNRDEYDYRRAALDALFFPRLVDRWWQNLRRAAGYKVQYFAAVEPQKRLAPHLHAAIRGAIPRQVIREVTAGTYCALWWPSIDHVVYGEHDDVWPAWDPVMGGYYDPGTGAMLTTWEQALDEIDADPHAEPFHVVSFGQQLDIKGLVGGSQETGKAVGYLCKYLTKSIAETYADDDWPDPAYESHIRRLHRELRWLPCSEKCANWLRYGVQPKDPTPGLAPGQCDCDAHKHENLGLGGRRVLVSRHWTGKTLDEHRGDRAEVVRAVLKEAGIEPPEERRMAADSLLEDGLPRFVWEDVPPEDRDYVQIIAMSIEQRNRWVSEYEQAKAMIGARSPDLVHNSFGNFEGV